MSQRVPNYTKLQCSDASQKSAAKAVISMPHARNYLNYGSPSIGAAQHLAAELLKSMAKVNIVRVPYRGTSPALMGTVSGETHMTFATASAGPTIQLDKVPELALTDATTPQR